MSNISTVKTAFKSQLGSVDGLQTVYTTPPAKLNPSALPALIIFAGAAKYQREGYQQPPVEVSRVYTLTLYGRPLTAGKYGAVEEEMEPFFERVSAALADPKLGSTAIKVATLTGDSGPLVLSYAGLEVEYPAIEFTVEVEMI